MSSFIKQFYAGTPYIPAELMLPEEIEDQDIIEEWLTAKERTQSTSSHSEEGNEGKTGRTGTKECADGVKE